MSNDAYAPRGDALDQCIFALERAERSIGRAQARLRDKKLDQRLTDKERRAISAEIGDLERKRQNVIDEIGRLDRLKRDEAFKAIALEAPTPAQKKKVKDLVEKVDDLIQTQMITKELITAATSLASAARGLKS